MVIARKNVVEKVAPDARQGSMHDAARIGLLSISDRASTGVYRDEGLPELESWLKSALKNPLTIVSRVIPDEQVLIEATLKEFVDTEKMLAGAHHRRHRSGAARCDA